MNVTAPTRTNPQAPASAGKDAAPRAEAGGNPLPLPGRNAPPQASAANPVSIEKALQQIQAYLKDSRRQLTFERDESSDRTVIKVVDPASGEVIRQFPSEEVLKIASIIDAQGFRTIDELA
jgi:flagellar protein FlaG